MLGAKEAIVRHEMRSAHELPTANTARGQEGGDSGAVFDVPVSPMMALLSPRILPNVCGASGQPDVRIPRRTHL